MGSGAGCPSRADPGDSMEGKLGLDGGACSSATFSSRLQSSRRQDIGPPLLRSEAGGDAFRGPELS